MAAYFISDLHLSAQHPQLTDAFADFLQSRSRDAHALYILGDFFDAWIGDDEDQALAVEVKSLLKQRTADGLAVYFMHGNRDFLLGHRFAEETGVTLLDEGTVIDLYGRPALLMHGDSLCTQDAEYMGFRAMVRNPAWQAQVLAVPLQQRRQMAADLRSKSQSMNAIKAQDIMDVTEDEVVSVMQAAGVDLLIHGHTHRPARHQLCLESGKAERWVLGDWHQQGWYLKAKGADLQLVAFDIDVRPCPST